RPNRIHAPEVVGRYSQAGVLTPAGAPLWTYSVYRCGCAALFCDHREMLVFPAARISSRGVILTPNGTTVAAEAVGYGPTLRPPGPRAARVTAARHPPRRRAPRRG